MASNSENLVDITKDYYDSVSADEFYHMVWGGEDIHIGLYDENLTEIKKASGKTVETMASMLEEVDSNTEILDIGSGYGGAARYLAKKYQCKVNCFNLSKTENERNREKNAEQGLDELITVTKGNFEDLPFDDNHFDVVWAQDAILHSEHKLNVFKEAFRVLKSGGVFIFTDPMQADDCPDGVLDPILERIHLKELGSVKKYKEFAQEVGFSVKGIKEMPEQLVNHYSSVLEKLKELESELISNGCEEDYINKMKAGLEHWIKGGKNNYLNWGIIELSKP